jgi:hypothetical protein
MRQGLGVVGMYSFCIIDVVMISWGFYGDVHLLVLVFARF